ncbi:Oidioi.mRNA.OKI2018_I69.chr1.g979.t1.cds [Oikopleura dioica]|uniref:Oidioi.mRNA.OKI2018_I69.chr1.g979.t1.cds n=1 Tax=Oikopleura dioica TaxID=34765 RepID=A0ABN7SLJ8_OIKDI|nr:Oidioi.mRNA.OKI2018_I69.chr1.g979.t1.cds [Oikopleura dioica]
MSQKESRLASVEDLLNGTVRSPIQLSLFKETLARAILKKPQQRCNDVNEEWLSPFCEAVNTVIRASEYWLAAQTTATRMRIAGMHHHQLARRNLGSTEDLVYFIAFRNIQRWLQIADQGYDYWLILEIWGFSFNEPEVARCFYLDVQGWTPTLPSIIQYGYQCAAKTSPMGDFRQTHKTTMTKLIKSTKQQADLCKGGTILLVTSTDLSGALAAAVKTAKIEGSFLLATYEESIFAQKFANSALQWAKMKQAAEEILGESPNTLIYLDDSLAQRHGTQIPSSSKTEPVQQVKREPGKGESITEGGLEAKPDVPNEQETEQVKELRRQIERLRLENSLKTENLSKALSKVGAIEEERKANCEMLNRYDEIHKEMIAKMDNASEILDKANHLFGNRKRDHDSNTSETDSEEEDWDEQREKEAEERNARKRTSEQRQKKRGREENPSPSRRESSTETTRKEKLSEKKKPKKDGVVRFVGNPQKFQLKNWKTEENITYWEHLTRNKIALNNAKQSGLTDSQMVSLFMLTLRPEDAFIEELLEESWKNNFELFLEKIGKFLAGSQSSMMNDVLTAKRRPQESLLAFFIRLCTMFKTSSGKDPKSQEAAMVLHPVIKNNATKIQNGTNPRTGSREGG